VQDTERGTVQRQHQRPGHVFDEQQQVFTWQQPVYQVEYSVSSNASSQLAFQVRHGEEGLLVCRRIAGAIKSTAASQATHALTLYPVLLMGQCFH
jgi:hypothetical protein